MQHQFKNQHKKEYKCYKNMQLMVEFNTSQLNDVFSAKGVKILLPIQFKALESTLVY